MKLLDVTDLTRCFGQNVAVNGVGFSVDEGEICGLIGPNGSGKTTTFNMISGFLRPTSGEIKLLGRSIVGASANSIARAGLVRTFQLVSVYREMTVRENLRTAHHIVFGRPPRPTADDIERSCDELLRRFDLADHTSTLAGTLPSGLQRTLSVASAVASRPRLLLLDEPLAGLNPSEKKRFVERLSELRATGLSILLIEHDVKSLMSLCDRLVVINFGKPVATGTPREIAVHPAVQEAYLGQPRSSNA